MRIPYGLILPFCLVGCGQKPSETTRPSPVEEPSKSTGHSHVRGKMLLADAGSYHALLTANLSKDGPRLEVFFETTGRNPKPVAVPLKVLKATVQVRTGEGEVKEIEFVPAPDSERPKDEPPGSYSHFVATVPWLKPDADHRVTVRALLDGVEEEIRWNDFIPRKYDHSTP